MFMHFLNNCNTRSQMTLDIPICETNKEQKSILFLGRKIWNKLSSNIKNPAITVFFTYSLEKGILEELN